MTTNKQVGRMDKRKHVVDAHHDLRFGEIEEVRPWLKSLAELFRDEHECPRNDPTLMGSHFDCPVCAVADDMQKLHRSLGILKPRIKRIFQ